jgi:Cu-processing system permease protein
MQTNVIISVAKKEIMDNIRNKWIIIVSVMFALLTLVVSYFGSLGNTGWQNLGVTIAGMANIVTLLLPIIALMLGYATIIGEIERGSMSALLALSVKRHEIIVGKLLGLAAVACFTILVGFGIAGLMIAANVSNVNYIDYGVFIGATMLLGLVFLTIAVYFSTIFTKRSTAMGGAIFLWFLFQIILPLVVFGLLTTSIDITEITVGQSLNVPTCYHIVELGNPISVYSSLLTITLGPISSMSAATMIPAPSWYSPGLLIGVLLIWIAIFFCFTYWRFNRKDI